MNAVVNIPRVLDLVTVERPDSASAHAQRLAREGADEGTLVWAQGQSNATGRAGNTWMSGHNNLHCALILRPELPFAECCQLALLATVACSIAMAEQAEPLIELRYRWPNDVLINRGKVAGVGLSGQLSGDNVSWLVLSVNVNVFEHPAVKGFAAASMRGEGFAQHDRELLLSAYSRELVSWLGRWSDEGFAPVKRAWLARGDAENIPYVINLKDHTISGVFSELSDNGDVILKTNSGDRETVALVDFFSDDFKGE